MLSDGTGAASQIYVCICSVAPYVDQPEIDKSFEFERSRFTAQRDDKFALVLIQLGELDRQAVSRQVVEHWRSILSDGIGAASDQDRPCAAASSTRGRLRMLPTSALPVGQRRNSLDSQRFQATLPPHAVPGQP